jgi:hypothetical protein
VINIKVNVEAQAKRSAYPGMPGIHRQTAFCLLSSVSCLLPYPPILPNLPRIHESIMQNKPNSPNDRTTATSYPTQIYGNIPLRPTPQKTNPNKANPPTQYAIRKTQYENQTQTNPMSK